MAVEAEVDYEQEWVNAIIHALGLAWAVWAAVVLMIAALRQGGPWQVAGCAAYAITLVAAYAASTLSHSFRHPGRRNWFRTADQAIIFLFIAGTWTPTALTWLRGGYWWLLHAAIWGIALTGFASKALFRHRVSLGSVSTTLYVLLGWMPFLAAKPLVGAIPRGLMEWIVAGGLCYMAGTIFFRYDDRIRYFHAAWHLLVIAGSACHFVGIYRYCTATPG